MRKGIATVVIALGLYACASTPDTYFATDIRVIPSDQLNECWLTAEATPCFKTPADFKPLHASGSVTLQHLPGSNGSVFNREIIEPAPAGFYDHSELAVSANPGCVPVKVTDTTTFSNTGQI